MKLYLARYATLAALCLPFLAAQHPDTTILKQVIIFGRHAVRTPSVPNSMLNGFSVLQFPTFPVSGQAMITPNGAANETLLGTYFRLWLTQENLLTGHDNSDSAFVYARADNAPLIVDTAQAFVAGLLPAAQVTVNTVPVPDPLFDPIDAGVAKLDNTMAIAAVNGRLGGNAQSISTAYAAEFALARAVLFNYPVGTTPAPATPAGKTDVTTIPITLTPGNSTAPVTPGGLADFYYAIDPFMMEYADGMALSNVGWGNLDAAQISQIFRVYDELLDFEYKTPYLAAVQSSNLGSHIVRTLVQAATGNATSGAVGAPSDKIVVLTAANTNLAGLAGLFRLDWLVDGDQPDVAALGGAIVFELRQSQRTGEFIVRVAYITQTMDQLRNRTPLTLNAPPANVPVFIPGCSVDNATFDCPLSTFVRITQHEIDPRYADLNN
ncbi:MAG TPA: histidine-type phosphatase [Bryobacteraceae bacterium]|nr:histidine-type phosphatase [Bryobacteraceae bacterium]